MGMWSSVGGSGRIHWQDIHKASSCPNWKVGFLTKVKRSVTLHIVADRTLAL